MWWAGYNCLITSRNVIRWPRRQMQIVRLIIKESGSVKTNKAATRRPTILTYSRPTLRVRSSRMAATGRTLGTVEMHPPGEVMVAVTALISETGAHLHRHQKKNLQKRIYKIK